jgi:multicomponent Na+:H+ antiporter subunit F
MTEWEIAAAVLVVALVPCGAVCLRASFAEGLAATQLAGTVTALALLVIAEAQQRQPFASLALALVILTFAGNLVFARFLERQR